MAFDFNSLRNSRSSALSKLQEQVSKMNDGGSSDDRYWRLQVDKAENGYAVIRFLPAPPGEDVPFVRIWDHGFKGPGGWYIENSLTTLGQDDPVSEYNSQLWNSTDSDSSPERKQAREQKRRLKYISNVYVVKDPANPENEGKVFLFSYGKKIFDKLNDKMYPQFPGEVAVNPFDFWEGADFHLKARKYEGYRNYDRSEFAQVKVLSDTDGNELSDEQLEEVWKSQHSLRDIIDPKNFKSYDELKAKLHKVLGLDAAESAPTSRSDDKEMSFSPKFKEEAPKAMSEKASPSMNEDDPPFDVDDDDEDSLSFFKNLVKD